MDETEKKLLEGYRRLAAPMRSAYLAALGMSLAAQTVAEEARKEAARHSPAGPETAYAAAPAEG